MERNVKMGVYTYNGEDISFEYYTTLRAIDKINFVKAVTDTIVDIDYYSMIRNLIFDYMIIKIFTNIDTSNIDGSNDTIGMIEDFINETNIVDIVKSNIDFNIIDELNNAVDANIEYKTGIHKNSITESLGHLLKTLNEKVSEVNTDEMMKMAKTLSSVSGELTADKVIEAYAKSDLFKEKFAQKSVDNVVPIKKTRQSKKTNTTK